MGWVWGLGFVDVCLGEMVVSSSNVVNITPWLGGLVWLGMVKAGSLGVDSGCDGGGVVGN
jgi:hypothetical protein